MNALELKAQINSLSTCVYFSYKGQDGGVDPFNENYFDMWYGDNYKKAESIDEVMNFPLFDGKSLSQIASQLDYIDW